MGKFEHLYIHIFVCVCVYIYIYIHIYNIHMFICMYSSIYIHMYIIYLYIYICILHSHTCLYLYGVATTSRLLIITGLFCERALIKRWYSAKETYNFKEPTNRSHPISFFASSYSAIYASFLCYIRLFSLLYTPLFSPPLLFSTKNNWKTKNQKNRACSSDCQTNRACSSDSHTPYFFVLTHLIFWLSNK